MNERALYSLLVCTARRMSELIAYGDLAAAHRQKSRTCCCVLVALVVLGTVFFIGLGAVYLPYLEALDARHERYNAAEAYVRVVCGNAETLANLGPVGERDCVRYRDTLRIDPERAASRDVLKMWNLCPEGECLIMSFSLVTLVTTLLPTFLLACAGTVALVLAWLVYMCYTLYRRNDELPVRMAHQFAAAMMSRTPYTPYDKTHHD
jgi:hypothetical protein